MDLHYHPGLQCFAGSNIYVYMYTYIYIYIFIHKICTSRRLKTRLVSIYSTCLWPHDIQCQISALTCDIRIHTPWQLPTCHTVFISECQCQTPFFRGNRWTKCPSRFALSRFASQELYTDSDNLGPASSINGSYPAQEKGSDLPFFFGVG